MNGHITRVDHSDVQRLVQNAVCTHSDSDGPPPDAFARCDDRDRRFSPPLDPLTALTLHEEARKSENICLYLIGCFSGPGDCCRKLDDAFSEFLDFNIVNPHESVSLICERAYSLLLRLPRRSPELKILLKKKEFELIPCQYFDCDPTCDKEFKSLKITRFIPQSVIATAVHVTMPMPSQSNRRLSIKSYLDFVMELLEAAVRLKSRRRRKPPNDRLVILIGFLWENWYRLLCLHRWGHLGAALDRGVSAATDMFLDVRGHDLLRNATGHRADRADRIVPPYMCRWAFALLKSNRANVAADFQTFIDRFSDAFGDMLPRCVKERDGSFQQCSGNSPAECMRFTGAKIEDQSAHTVDCKRACQSLFWDEQSFRSVDGTRAVCLEEVKDGKLTYRAASELTMAVSHVWSHGQGGRVDGADVTGFNRCLHDRYCSIARNLGCDSYWMDTPCIPEDHSLRREAIEGINPVFANSKITLVCDKDLMMIDISTRSVPAFERLLAVLLVCDWNARAWTLLEAIKGANNLSILCLNDDVIRLSEVLRKVHLEGSVELINMCLSAEHLLPKNRLGFVGTLEATGTMLSRRHASRTGDEIVIWSLLRGSLTSPQPLCSTAEELWRNCLIVNTAFLVSTVPRIQGVKGFSWAPSRPDFPLNYDSSQASKHFAFEGDGSAQGVIHHKSRRKGRAEFTGLHASWLVCKPDDLRLSKCAWGFVRTWIAAIMFVLNIPRIRALRHFQSKAKLEESARTCNYYWAMCWVKASTRSELRRIVGDRTEAGRSVAMLRAIDERIAVDVPFAGRGSTDVPLIVLATSSDEQVWTWDGVFAWDQRIALPPFRRQSIELE